MFEFKEAELAEARRIVSCLELPAEFGTDADLDLSDIECQLEDVVNGDYFVSCGISKAVIIIEDLSFVIKIPFNGHWYSDWNSDTDEFEEHFEHFRYANDVAADDYCKDELDNIILIKKSGYGCFVPDMIYLTTVSGFPIYIQEKVVPKNEQREDDVNPTANSLAEARAGGYWDLEWAATAIDMYGLTFFQNFMAWADRNCRAVMSDLHDGNYGYDMSGRPVILDVSGFRD